jgi:hypothetical protein
MSDATHFWATATQFVATMMTNMPLQRDHNEMVDCSSNNFFKQNSLVFEGIEGYLAADNWITNFQDL